jgi:hypothetical protein
VGSDGGRRIRGFILNDDIFSRSKPRLGEVRWWWLAAVVADWRFWWWWWAAVVVGGSHGDGGGLWWRWRWWLWRFCWWWWVAVVGLGQPAGGPRCFGFSFFCENCFAESNISSRHTCNESI